MNRGKCVYNLYIYTSICIFTTANIHHLYVRFDEASIRYSLQASEASVKDADPADAKNAPWQKSSAGRWLCQEPMG